MAAQKNKNSNRNSYQQKRNSNHYNATSSAYDYAQEVNLPNPVKKWRIRIRKREKYVMAIDQSAKLSVWVYCTIGLLFTCAFVSVLSISHVWNQTRQNGQLVSQLKEAHSHTAELTVEVSQSMDLTEIEYIARNKLEMSEPQIHQIKYISIPKNNYTVNMAGSDDEVLLQKNKSSFSLSAIKDFFIKD